MTEDFNEPPNLIVINRVRDPNRKITFMEKEILSLTGGHYPSRLIEPSQLLRKQGSTKNQKWVEAPIIQENKSLGEVYCWQKEEELAKTYVGERFNVQAQVIKPTKQEYTQLVTDAPAWTYDETLYLLGLMEAFNLNFTVVQDKYCYQGKTHTTEQLKEHYYKINNRVLSQRGTVDHPLHSYKYDADYEISRKVQLEKHLQRSKDTSDMEKKIIEEIRRLDIAIRKEEREQISLKKALKLDEVVDEGVEDNIEDLMQNNNADKLNVTVYTRQQYLTKPLPLPPKTNAKMMDVLQGLNIPERVIANQENEDFYDQLRKQVLLMFSAQRYVKKKENEKRILEDKKKKMVHKEEDAKKTPPAVDSKKKGGK